jgi:hypothetical protein
MALASTKVYELIAAGIRTQMVLCEPDTPNNDMLFNLAITYAQEFRKSNHNFEPKRFLLACGYDNDMSGSAEFMIDVQRRDDAIAAYELGDDHQMSEHEMRSWRKY